MDVWMAMRIGVTNTINEFMIPLPMTTDYVLREPLAVFG